MLQISSKDLLMSNSKHDYFKNVLCSFYKSALYNNECFENFIEQLNKISTNKNYFNNVTLHIYNFIKNNNSSLTDLDNVTFTAKVLAKLYCTEENLFKKLKLGGKNNFTNYIELSMLECISSNASKKAIIGHEKAEVLKSVRDMQYFYYTSPDQLLR